MHQTIPPAPVRFLAWLIRQAGDNLLRWIRDPHEWSPDAWLLGLLLLAILLPELGREMFSLEIAYPAVKLCLIYVAGILLRQRQLRMLAIALGFAMVALQTAHALQPHLERFIWPYDAGRP